VVSFKVGGKKIKSRTGLPAKRNSAIEEHYSGKFLAQSRYSSING